MARSEVEDLPGTIEKYRKYKKNTENDKNIRTPVKILYRIRNFESNFQQSLKIFQMFSRKSERAYTSNPQNVSFI